MDTKTQQLVDKIKDDLSACLEKYVFEPNNAYTQQSIINDIEHYASQQQLAQYRVVCDASNNPPSGGYDPIRSLKQGISEDDEDDFIIESDEKEYKLFYRDTLYRVFDKRTGTITSFFEEDEIPALSNGILNATICIQPVMSVDSIHINFKVVEPKL